jgi:hypothetical protein
MPLNKITGETIEGLDPIFRVVSADKYKALPRLTTIVREATGKQFKTEVEVERPIWEAALGHAQIAYWNAGAAPPLRYDVTVQEYPRTGQVAFLFCARVGGEELYVPAVFALSPQQVAELTLAGDWLPLRAN